MRLLLILFAMSAAAAAVAEPLALFVSPRGNDHWSGRLAEPNAAKTDGPLATIVGARDALRRLRAAGPLTQPVHISMAPGVYPLSETLVFTPEDSGTSACPITYEAAAKPGTRSPELGTAILSGGRIVTGWQPGEGKLWTARVPEVAEGKWYFQQLFVNGSRRIRARSPNEGQYYAIVRKGPPARDPATGVEAPQDKTAFVYTPGEIKPWANLDDVNVVVFHSWETSRLRIKSVDDAKHVVQFTGPACWAFESWGPKQRYYVENVPEALDAPGEWYLDRKTGVVSYYPLPGEDMTKAEVIAPRLTRLLELRGEPDAGLYVEHLTFKGLAFHYEDWVLEPQGHSDPQAVVTAPAALIADGARNCTVENCDIAHVGDYALWFRRGCKDNRIVHNRVHDMGVGGVRLGEAAMASEDAAESSGNLVDNNHIFDGGHVYHGGVGLWVAQSSHNTISHNEIHDLRYSGMSIGWNWGDEPNRCHHNVIEYNHVHHCMNGYLNDGGAIYTLGMSPGSVIRNNVFHDIWPYSAIGWGIYLDATCSQYLVENNIVYNTLAGALMFNNGGHEHVIRNNVFALGAQYMLWPYWGKRPNTFTHNLIYLTQGDLIPAFSENSLKERIQAGEPLGQWDGNLYWNPNNPDLHFFQHGFPEWQALGLDQHSIIADPQFVNAEAHDFRLKPTSPTLPLGFKPIDTSNVGLYGDAAWVAEARAVKHPPTVLPAPPPPPKPTPVNDDFENTVVGDPPEGATVSGEEKGASIRVSDEQAAGGQHSLKFTDRADLTPSWQPHMFYQPHFTTGTIREAFDLYLGPDALVFTEWRDNSAYPDNIGPSVTFDAQGQVTASGKLLTTIPLGKWVHVEVECKLGKSAPKTYTVAVTVPRQDPQRFADLAFTGKDFREVHWLGFVSNATTNSVFYLDNVGIQPE